MLANAQTAVNSARVVIGVSASQGVTAMRFSNSLPIDAGTWQALAPTADWDLEVGADGVRSVFAQFRSPSGVSEVVSASVLLDTIPPNLAIQSPSNGAKLDLSGGDPFALQGMVSDNGSGVDRVEMVAGTPPESFPATVSTDGSWTRLAGAPVTGAFSYAAVARDVAGNVSSVSINVEVIGPPLAPVVQRSSAHQITSVQAGLVQRLSADRSELVFVGDQRSWLEDVSTLFSGPIGATAPDGLLLRLKSVRYDSAADLTVVSSEQASFFDVYSRYSTPRLASASSDPTADACDRFSAGRTLSVLTPEVRISYEEEYEPQDASISASASVELAARSVAVYDQDIQVDIGWGGIDVERVKLVAGSMLCGKVTGEFNLSLEQVLQEAAKYGIDTTGGKAKLRDLLQSPLGKLPKAEADGEVPLGAVPIPGTPLIVQPTLTAGPFAEADLKLTASAEGEFSIGFLAGWDNGFVFDPQAEGQVTKIAVSGEAKIAAGFRAALGLKIQGGPAFAKADNLFEVTGGGQATFSSTWENDEVSISGGRSSVTAEICSLLKGSIGIKIDVGVKVGPVDAETTLLDETLAGAEAPRKCPFARTFDRSSPPSVSSEVVPTGRTLEPYEVQLTTTSDSPSVWRVAAGDLPRGIILQSDGKLTGTPEVPGTWSFSVEVEDGFGQVGSRELSIEVVLGDDFTVGTTSLSGTVGEPVTAWLQTLPQVPAAEATWTVRSGVLPPGVGLALDGRLTGSPTSLGRWTFVVQATYGGRETPPTLVTFQARSGSVQVAPGSDFTCALISGGQVRCWGRNNWGQLGNGTKINSLTPVAVSSLSGVSRLASGDGYACAIVVGGEVRCWGSNDYGQLGDGTRTDSATPVAVSGVSGATQITAGSNHACALVAGGEVRCWGSRGNGQLGDGTTGNTNFLSPVSGPVPVVGISDATEVAAGSDHTCALLVDRLVRCWGSNGLGQLGNGTLSNATTPVLVTGLVDVSQITAGGSHSCALVSGGGARCWGLNSKYQLGDGTSSNSSTPVAVAGIADAVRIDAGSVSAHTCALGSDGQVRCWGFNVSGQLGNGTTVNAAAPVTVSSLVGTSSNAVPGAQHSCALTFGGQMRCWGGNSFGQLGNGTTSSSSLPVEVRLE